MSEDADKKPRSNPGKMTKWIGKWVEEGAVADGVPINPFGHLVFVVAKVIEGGTDKDVKAAIKELGHGKYDILTGRADVLEFKAVTADKFA